MPVSNDEKLLLDFVAQFRKERGFASRDKLAQALGVHVNTIRNWETAEGFLRFNKFVALCDRLGIVIWLTALHDDGTMASGAVTLNFAGMSAAEIEAHRRLIAGTSKQNSNYETVIQRENLQDAKYAMMLRKAREEARIPKYDIVWALGYPREWAHRHSHGQRLNRWEHRGAPGRTPLEILQNTRRWIEALLYHERMVDPVRRELLQNYLAKIITRINNP